MGLSDVEESHILLGARQYLPGYVWDLHAAHWTLLTLRLRYS